MLARSRTGCSRYGATFACSLIALLLRSCIVRYRFYTTHTSMSSLVALFHNRWSAPMLAELHKQRGSRFVTFTDAWAEPRVAAADARRADRARPRRAQPRLRPPAAARVRPHRARRAVAAACRPARRGAAARISRSRLKWSMPAVPLWQRPSRFSELARRFGVTPRALALALKDLEAAGLVDRR